MTVGELKETIKDLPDYMEVKVPSSLDGDYDVDAKVEVCTWADMTKFLMVHEA